MLALWLKTVCLGIVGKAQHMNRHGSARHETQCLAGCATQPLYPSSRARLG